MATQLTYQIQPASTLSSKAITECYNLGREPFSWTDSPSDLQAWQNRLSSPGATFFTVSSETSTLSEPSSSTVCGFLLALPRTHPELPSQTFHISLAVISPSHRGQGILPRLFAMVDSYCCEEVNMERVTICTFEEQLPRMYGLLKGNGWEEVCKREPTGEGPRWSAQSLFVRDAVRGVVDEK
jgi:ribosomal protein S18 acetylase RimI-like enzyme